MLKSKRIVVLLIVLLITLGISSIQVKASNYLDLENLLNTNDLAGQIGANELASETTANEIIANQIYANEVYVNQLEANEEASGSIIQPTSNTSTSGNDLPQTGVTEDITVMFFIVVCVILAIYAYKKIRDYKV